jgi:hypothetical protein
MQKCRAAQPVAVYLVGQVLNFFKVYKYSEARFFEIRKQSAMTVALSPKKTFT